VKSDRLTEIVGQLGLRCRMKVVGEVEEESWSNFLISPCSGYLETQQGPRRIQELEYVAIECAKPINRGLKLSPTVRDYSGEVIQILKMDGASFRMEGTVVYVFGAES